MSTQKIVIASVLWIDRRLDNEDKTDIVIEGMNTKGTHVSVRFENLSSFMLAYIADECAQALCKLRAQVHNSIDIVKQTVDS